uniref:Uncharacterized protein n=1 Tax=Anguilla anguilla TaxID=7936 RepID=A0A0E9RTB9_ANGAN
MTPALQFQFPGDPLSGNKSCDVCETLDILRKHTTYIPHAHIQTTPWNKRCAVPFQTGSFNTGHFKPAIQFKVRTSDLEFNDTN